MSFPTVQQLLALMCVIAIAIVEIVSYRASIGYYAGDKFRGHVFFGRIGSSVLLLVIPALLWPPSLPSVMFALIAMVLNAVSAVRIGKRIMASENREPITVSYEQRLDAKYAFRRELILERFLGAFTVLFAFYVWVFSIFF